MRKSSLFVIDDAGTSHVLDLYEAIVPKANYQFTDIRKLGSSSAGFSSSFRVPATPRNVDLFGALYDAGASTSYQTRKKKAARLEVDTMPVFKGYLRLIKIIEQKGKFHEFEVMLFGEVSTLTKDLGESKLKDCDFSAFDHTCNYTNVTNSWAGSLLSGSVVYGFIDYGIRFGCNSGAWRDITNTEQALDPDHLKPCVKVTDVVDAIFAKAGWTWQSDWHDSEGLWNQCFIPWVDHANVHMQLPESTAPTINKLIWAGPASDNTKTIEHGTWESVLDTGITYVDNVAPYFDGGSHFNTSTGRYTVPAAGTYSITVNIPISRGASGSNHFEYCLYDNAAGAPIEGSVVTGNCNTSLTLNNTTYTVELPLSADVEVRIMGDTADPFTGKSVTIQGSTAGGGEGASDAMWIRFNDAPARALGSTIAMSAAAPEAGCADVLSDLGKLFNLVFIADPDKDNHMKIEPFGDYIASGDVVDWNDKLDLNKDVTLTPAAEFQKKELVLTYQKDEDFYNQSVDGAVREDGVRIYGEQVVDNSGNDFSTGQQKIETKLFASSPAVQVWGSNMVALKLYNQDGKPIKPKLRILQFAKHDANVTWYMFNGATATAQTECPYMGHYETFNAGFSDDDLNFGQEEPFHYISETPTKTLFDEYWAQFLQETYSEDGRVMTAYFRLDPIDVISMKFNDRIICKGQEWRINKVSGYGVGVDESVKVELVKIISERRCQFSPHSVSATGVVTMVDADGSTSAGNQNCCELYGYVWDGSQCLDRKKTDVSNIPTSGTPLDPQGPVIGTGGTDFPNSAMWRSVVPPPDFRGTNENIGAGSYHRIGGDDHDLTGSTGMLMMGRNGLLLHDGEFVHGGGWQASNDPDAEDEIAGRGQFGRILFLGQGTLPQTTSLIELKVMGRETTTEFNLPNDTVAQCEMQLAILSDAVASYNTYIFHFAVVNDGGTITASGTDITPTVKHGTKTCHKLKLTASGELITFELGAHNCSQGQLSGDTYYITGTLSYTWARLRP